MMKEAPGSSETSDLTRATQRNIPEDTTLHSHRRENLKSYTVNVVSSSPILVTLMMEALSSSETSVHTRATRHNIPEDGILHSNRRENLKSYLTDDKFLWLALAGVIFLVCAVSGKECPACNPNVLSCAHRSPPLDCSEPAGSIPYPLTL
jgi:hypothetical protein